MSLPSSKRYTRTAMLLHWVLAVAILGTFAVGLYVGDLPFSLRKLQLINWHKWAGVTILVLSVARLLWRVTHRPPGLPAAIDLAMPGWQKAAYHATHHLLYLLFFIVPMAGWTYSSAKGFPVVWFGVLRLPDLVTKDDGLAKLLWTVHEWSAYALIALVALHVAAALKHHVIDRDGLLERMLPGRG